MTLQYRASDGSLLYHLCATAIKRHRLMAACCCYGPQNCEACADSYTLTIADSAELYNGVYVLGPKIDEPGVYCRWDYTKTVDCSGVAKKISFYLSWSCVGGAIWAVDISGPRYCTDGDHVITWHKARGGCDPEGAYTFYYSDVGISGSAVVS